MKKNDFKILHKKRNEDLFLRKKTQSFFHHPDKLGKGRPILANKK